MKAVLAVLGAAMRKASHACVPY
jgi:hypothetical protein